MGANVWLLKGYFDTVPRELDEAAKVDGASPRPHLLHHDAAPGHADPRHRVHGRRSSASSASSCSPASSCSDVDSQTLGVGLYGMTIGKETNSLFGQFAAGALLASVPTVAALPGLPEAARRRPDPGVGEVTGSLDLPRPAGPAAPRRLGALRLQPVPRAGETVRVLRPGPARGAGSTAVHLRTAPDGEQQFTAAVVDRRTDTDTWWRAELTCHNPVTSYRFLLEGGPTSYAWLNGTGLHVRDVPDAADFRLVTYDAAARLGAGCRGLPDLPGPLRRRPVDRRGARLGGPRRLGRPGHDRRGGIGQPALRRRPRRHHRPPGPHRVARGDGGLPDARSSPPGPTTATTRRASTRSTRCSAATRRCARLVDACHDARAAGDGRLHDQPHRRRPRVVPTRPRTTRTATSATSTSTRTATTSPGSGCRRCPSSTTTARELRRRVFDDPDGVVRRWLGRPGRPGRLAGRRRQHDRPLQGPGPQPRGGPADARRDGRGPARTRCSSASTSTTTARTRSATAGTAS